jgi:hypothetical protein
MKFTTLTVHRGTGPIASQTVVASGIVAQIDQQSLDMQNFDHGASPFDLFNVEASTWLIQRNDHLVDENQTSDVYTVSARVETFPDGHSEFQATMPVGS